MPKSIPLKEGQKFGRLTVIKLDHKKEYINPKGIKSKYEYYLCKCDCGNYKLVNKYSLKRKQIISCGCFREKNFLHIINKHNLSRTKIYTTWQNMKHRCYNKNFPQYKDYGGRGITICQEWLDKENGFMNFYNWALTNGYKEELTIDRIDNNGNYKPSNCRWITQKEQSKNKQNNHLITYNGETHCIAEWSDKIGIKREILTNRINAYHWSIERALETPVKFRNTIKALTEEVK